MKVMVKCNVSISPRKVAKVAAGPYLRWLKALITDAITGYVDKAPETLAPRWGASAARTKSTETVTNTLAGNSHFGAKALWELAI